VVSFRKSVIFARVKMDRQDSIFLHREFCFLAEDDRDKVAAAITPLWVIRDDNNAI
jgi:hypothetical protein